MAVQNEMPEDPGQREKRERGARFRLVREQLGFRTQTAFGSEIGVQPNTVSQWEGGVRFPEPELLDVLCRLTGRPAEWFLYGREAPAQRPAPADGAVAEPPSSAVSASLLKRSVAAVIARDRAHPMLGWSPEQLGDFVAAVYHVVSRHPDRDPDKVALDLMG